MRRGSSSHCNEAQLDWYWKQRLKEIEFTYDPEQLPIFHHRKRIEVMLLEQPREFAHCSLPIYGHHGSRHKLFNRASDEAVHPFVSLSFRLHLLVSSLWLTLGIALDLEKSSRGVIDLT
jgi:hypothetical protein